MLFVATVTIGVLAAAVVVLAVGIVFVRVRRTVAARRRAALAGGPRRALLAFVADNGEEGADELVAISDEAWAAAEPVANALLGKVRGDAHKALAEVFQRRGAAVRARRALRHRSAVRRARAAEMLGDLELRSAVGDLCDLIDDRNPEVRIVAVRALGKIGDPAAAWRLLAGLDRRDPVPSLLVTAALVQLGPDTEITLTAALDHPNPRVRVVCLDALGLLGATGAAARIAKALDADPSPEARLAAAAALGKLGARAGVPPLLDALDSDRPTALRAAAARALGELGAVATVPRLETQLADAQYRVAHEAAHALRRLGPAGHAALRRASLRRGTAAAHAHEALALIALGAVGDEAQTLAGVS
jgi:HEAT repeat protein